VAVYLYPSFVYLISSRNQHESVLPTVQKAVTFYILILAPFVLKEWDSYVSYILLSILSVFGFLALVAMLGIGFSKGMIRIRFKDQR
jgi:hypothetical protein